MGLELNVISEQEADMMIKAEVARLQVIDVDDFDPEDLKAGAARSSKKSKAA